MDWAIKNMDFSITHWDSYRRRFPAAFPLMRTELLRRKKHWEHHAFGTCNFSLILRGRGEYWRLGQKWTVEAPCVIVQLPGEYVEYGPVAPDGTWDELYLMYHRGLFPAFEKQHLVDPGRPVWPILNPAVKARIAELATVCSNPVPAQIVDCVDRLCELLIVETHLEPWDPVDGSDEALQIRRVERELASNLDQDIDLDEMVARHGMSMATFRRRWTKAIRVPPARYRLEARLREACRLLSETTRPVYEIARMVGFHDELYFSRRFRQELKLAPRAYRQMYRVHQVTGSPHMLP